MKTMTQPARLSRFASEPQRMMRQLVASEQAMNAELPARLPVAETQLELQHLVDQSSAQASSMQPIERPLLSALAIEAERVEQATTGELVDAVARPAANADAQPTPGVVAEESVARLLALQLQTKTKRKTKRMKHC